MTTPTSRLNLNLDKISQYRKPELNAALLAFGFIAFSFFVTTDLYTSIFVSRPAQIKLIVILILLIAGCIALLSFVFIHLKSLNHKYAKNPPSNVLFTLDLKKRWNQFQEDELCLILLATQPSIYKANTKKRLLQVSHIYSSGDIAANLRKVINNNSYFFDTDEISQIENACSFFVPMTTPAPKTSSTKNSKLEKKADSYRKWPIYLTDIMLTYMLEKPTPLKPFSEEELVELVENYRREKRIPNGNSYGLATSFVVEEWFPTLPESFRAQKNMPK